MSDYTCRPRLPYPLLVLYTLHWSSVSRTAKANAKAPVYGISLHHLLVQCQSKAPRGLFVRSCIPCLSVEPREKTDSGELGQANIIIGDFNFTAYARESEADSPCLGFAGLHSLAAKFNFFYNRPSFLSVMVYIGSNSSNSTLEAAFKG